MSVTSAAFKFEIETPSAVCGVPEAESEESSSIGQDSDEEEEEEEVGSRCSRSASDEENEAQSCYSGGFCVMEELEQVLPMRRGISKFYDGKSKSFTSLADVSASSSIQEIIKPENAYARRRRNLLAFSHVWDRGQGSPLRGNAAGGISKRPLSSSKSTLALAIAMTHSESHSSASEDSSSSNVSCSPCSPPPIHLPPLHPRSRGSHRQFGSSWKSYSVADLQRRGAPANTVPHEKTGLQEPT